MSKFYKSMIIIVAILMISGITVASKSIYYEATHIKEVNSSINLENTKMDSSTKTQNAPTNTPNKTLPSNSSNATTSGTKSGNVTTPVPNKTNTPVLASPVPTSPVPTSLPQSGASRLVVIDAGHGGVDPGTSDFGMVEKNITLDIATQLDNLLKKAGINTHMIRKGDEYSDHRDRIKSANSMNASLYISIHIDWFKDLSVNGTTTYYINNKNLVLGNLNEIQYAQNIQSELMKRLSTNDRRIVERPDLAILKYATMPAVLVELAFLSNKGNADLLATKEFRQKCAEGLAEGIRISIEKSK